MWITKEWCSNYILITFHVLTHLQFTSFFKLKKFLLIFQSVLVPLFIQLLYYLSCLILYSLPFLSIDLKHTVQTVCTLQLYLAFINYLLEERLFHGSCMFYSLKFILVSHLFFINNATTLLTYIWHIMILKYFCHILFCEIYYFITNRSYFQIVALSFRMKTL